MKNTVEKEVYQGAIDTTVKLIDWTPLNLSISKTVGYDVECRLGSGYIADITAIFDKEKDYEEKRSIIIDNECCGATSSERNMYISDINDGGFNVSLFRGVGFFKSKDKDGNKIMSMFPSVYFDIDEDDIKKCLTEDEVPLYILMKTRYDYNPRIRNNERQILNLIYHSKPDLIKNGWTNKIQKTLDV